MKKVKAEIDMQVGHSFIYWRFRLPFLVSYKRGFMMVEVTLLYALPNNWTVKIHGTKYSRMDQVKFFENSLYKI